MASCGCPTNSSPTTSSSVLVPSRRRTFRAKRPQIIYDRKTCKVSTLHHPDGVVPPRRAAPFVQKRDPGLTRWRFQAASWYSSLRPTTLAAVNPSAISCGGPIMVPPPTDSKISRVIP